MKVLVAEDVRDVSELYKLALEFRGHEVTLADNGEDCLAIYHNKAQSTETKDEKSSDNSAFDVVVLDYRMPKVNGLDAAKEILAVNPKQRIIFASSFVKETLVDSVKHLRQVVELIQKPFHPDALVALIEDTATITRLNELNSEVKEIGKTEPSGDQYNIFLDILKKIQRKGSFH